MMTFVKSFPSVSDPVAKVLILGSMPGAASLAAGQYYAHPRNHFWPIMGELIGADPALLYEARLERLKQNRIALWDVLKCCVRPGSLDSSITDETANDFVSFFTAHPEIRHVFFNGTKAEAAFRKFAALALGINPLSPRQRGSLDASCQDPRLRGESRELKFTRLPSTSPANASWSFERKLEAWRRILKNV